MRRTISSLVLAALVGLALASCSSSTDTSTGNTSTTAASATTTTADKAPLVLGPKCQAVQAMLQNFIAANDTKPNDKDAMTKAIETAATNLKTQVSQLAADVDSALPYLRKLAASETPTAAEKDAGEKAKDKMNLYFNSTCKKAADRSPDAPKPTSTTAAVKK